MSNEKLGPLDDDATDVLVQAAAQLRIDCDNAIQKLLEPLGDDALRALLVALEEGNCTYNGDGTKAARHGMSFLDDAVQTELRFRYIFSRAEEVGCDVYCVMHDCAITACPPGCIRDD